MRTTLVAGVALVMLAIVVPVDAQAADCPFADATASTATLQQLSGATVCLVNQQRAAAGLDPLAASAPLELVGQRYAEHMVATQRFAHVDDQGHTVTQRVEDTVPGAADRWAGFGENLGWGTDGMDTPHALVQAWMNSPEHRVNVLYPAYSELGVGVAPGAPVPGVTHALTYAAEFGERAPQPRATASASRSHARHRHCIRAARHSARRARHGCTNRVRRRG